jgi:pyruvate formate lyase activating enzyme
MNIGGFQKTSLLDYPNYLSAIIWTQECNFKCPFCYNRNLVFGKEKSIDEQEILSYLKKRQGIIEGVVLSGGEPFLQKDINDFIEKIKKLDYLVKIDTNGSFPDKLKVLIDNKMIDYISMDVKAPKKKYDTLSGIKINTSRIQKSIDLIKNGPSDYEFRTTFVPDLLKKEDIIEIGKWLDGSKNYFLQQFKNIMPLVSNKFEKVIPYPKEYLIETLESIKPFFKKCDVRGI